MKTTKYIILAGLSNAALAWAEPATGRVVDVRGQPVRGAAITVEGIATKTRTDHAGSFQIEAAIGATLVIEWGTLIALATVTGDPLGDVVLGHSEAITVHGEGPASVSGAARLDRQDLHRVPGSGGDIVRTLAVMPGVVNQLLPVGFTGVAIRGSSPQDSKILIDDFEVPILYHDIGFRSIIPAESLDSLEYIPGGFGVAHGRASSGIVQLTTRPGAARGSAQAEVSIIDGGLIAQGPAGADTRYMLALRRSTIDFVLPALIPDNVDLSLTTVPRYWDGQLRLDHTLNRRWRLTLSAFGADDEFALVTSKNEEAASKRFESSTRFARLTAGARYESPRWKANVAVSGLLADYEFRSGLAQHVDVQSPQLAMRSEVTRSAPRAIGLANVEWRLGAETQVTRWTLDFAFPEEVREGEPPVPFDPDDTSTRFTGVVWTPNHAAWTSTSADLDRRIRVTAGLRADVFGRSDELALQPRGEIRVALARALKLRLAAGAYRRAPDYQTEILSTTAKSERARQTILGLEWEPDEATRIQASAYHTDRSALLRNGEMGELENTGRGTTDGGELLVTHRRDPWFAWLGYSYSRSLRVDAPGATERRFDFDQPHSLNAAASWRRGRWQLGGRFQLHSGMPQTPRLGGILDSDTNTYTPINGAVNSERAPMHHQLDLRVDYSWAWGPMHATAFLDVQNVYMNESVVSYLYSYDFTQRSSFKSIPLIPSLGLRGVL
jgi:hypothetical protein